MTVKTEDFFANSDLVGIIARTIAAGWEAAKTHYDDLVGEGYLALWSQIDGYVDGSPYSLRSYCCRVIHNAMYDYLRRVMRYRRRHAAIGVVTSGRLGVEIDPPSPEDESVEMVDVGVTHDQLCRIARGDARITSPEISAALRNLRHYCRPDRDQLEGMLKLGGRECVGRIADDLGVHRVTVWRWMKDYGIPRPRPPYGEMPPDDQLRDLLSRKSLRQVARDLGVPRETLRRRVTEHSIGREQAR